MDLCTTANANTPGSCTIVQWETNNNNKCTLYTSQASCNSGVAGNSCFPNNVVLNGVRSARLLTPTAPNVTDATFMQAPSSLYNLDLCGGGSLNYYDRAFIGHVHSDNTFRIGLADIWLLTCLGYSYYTVGGVTSSSLLNTATVAAGLNMGVPNTADDCMRLCAFYNDHNGDNGCRMWHFMNDNTCNMYSSRGNIPTGSNPTMVSASIVAAGLYRGGTGNMYPALSYKRSLPPSEGYGRHHARDTLAEVDGIVAEYIIPFRKPLGVAKRVKN